MRERERERERGKGAYEGTDAITRINTVVSGPYSSAKLTSTHSFLNKEPKKFFLHLKLGGVNGFVS